MGDLNGDIIYQMIFENRKPQENEDTVSKLRGEWKVLKEGNGVRIYGVGTKVFGEIDNGKRLILLGELFVTQVRGDKRLI